MADVLSVDSDPLAAGYDASWPPSSGASMPVPASPAPPAVTSRGADPEVVAAKTGTETSADDMLRLQREDALREIKKATDSGNAALDRAIQSAEKETTIADERGRALAPAERNLIRSTRDLSGASANIPQLQPAPAAPKRGNEPGADETWLMTAGLLGAIAGAFTRRHVTNALAAFSGAMQGYNEGSKLKFDQNMEVWRVESQRITDTNRSAMDAYKAVLEDRKLNVEQKRIALEVEARRWDDKAMAQAAATKNDLAIAHAFDYKAQLQEKLVAATEKMTGQHNAFQKAQWDSQAADFIAKNPQIIQRMRRGEIPPPPTNARTGYAGSLAQAELAELSKYSDFDYGRFAAGQAGRTSAARINATIDPMTTRATEIEFVRGQAGRSVQSLNVAIDHLGALTDLSRALKNGDTNFINSFKNYINSELGATAPFSFDVAKQIVSAEVIKAVVANGGGVTERQEIARMVSSARSEDQLIGMIDVYKRLMAGQLLGLERRYTSGGGRDFNRKLEPATVDELRRIRETGIARPPSREFETHINHIANVIQNNITATANVGGAIAGGAVDATSALGEGIVNAVTGEPGERAPAPSPGTLTNPFSAARRSYGGVPKTPLLPGWTLEPVP